MESSNFREDSSVPARKGVECSTEQLKWKFIVDQEEEMH